jgi:hypothetical protein
MSIENPINPETMQFSPEKRTEFLQELHTKNEDSFNQLEKDDFLRFAGVPTEIITGELKQVPYEQRLNKAIDIGLVAVINGSSWSYLSNRPVLFTKVGGENVPFYRSSEGTGGNKQAGVWYPFFGIADEGWIIKGGGDDFKTCYNNPALKKIQTIFGETFNWDHSLDFVKGDMFKHHPLVLNQDSLKKFCPPLFLDKALYNQIDLNHFDLNEPESKHREWIHDILKRMYEKYPDEFVKEIIKTNEDTLVDLGFQFKKN